MSSTIAQSHGFRQEGHARPRDIVEWIADAVLILSAAYALQLFTPNLAPVEFSDLNVREWAVQTSDGNLFNQLVWICLAGFASIAVIRAPYRLTRFAAPLWPILALLALCVISTLWSDHPNAAFRRSAEAAIIFYCFLVGVAYASSLRRAVTILYIVFWASLLLNLSVASSHWAFDISGQFRGVYGHKNGFGAIAALAVLFGLSVIRLQTGISGRSLCLFYIVAWGVLLFLSGSKTSIALVILVPVIYSLIQLFSAILRLNVGILLICGLAMVGLIGGLLVFGGGYTPAHLVGYLIGDASFTGRDAIWQFVLSCIDDRWLLGYGYGSFWGVGFESPNLRSPIVFIRLLNQAHNGYLDLLISVGLVGLVLFIFQILQTGAQSERVHYIEPALFQIIWMLIIFSLVHNITETSLFRGFSPVWLFTLIAIFIASRAYVEARDNRNE